MERSNIWTDFKHELGYATASIQYIELLVRMGASEHNDDININNVCSYAKKYGLSVSALPSSFQLQIVNNYIVQIHSCVEHFLNNFRCLVGSPTYKKDDYDPKTGNRLQWTLIHSCLLDDENKRLYYICNYYRLLRNVVIHKGEITSEIKDALSKAVTARDKSILFSACKLQAPNNSQCLCFDDQVLFARAAKQLLGKIYYDSQYNWSEIINYEDADIKRITQKYTSDYVKRKIRISHYLKNYYPVPKTGLPINL